MLKGMLRIALVAVVMALCVNTTVAAGPDEIQVKAAFVYNFTKFITLPQSAFKDEHDPFVIALTGSEGMAKELSALTKRTTKGRKIVFQYFAPGQPIGHCHALFIAYKDKQKTKATLTSLQDRPIITISDTEQFAHMGGVIQITAIRERFRFAINKGTADRGQIKIASQLLVLAIEVVKDES